MDIDWSLIVAAGALGVSALVAIRNWNGPKHSAEATRLSAEANTIAQQALEIARAQHLQAGEIVVQPQRYNPDGGGVAFTVVASAPVYEVRLEFRDYDRFDHQAIRRHVSPGDLLIRRNEFDSWPSELPKPNSRFFAARAAWRISDDDEWTVGLDHLASKDNFVFHPVDHTVSGDDHE